MSATPSVGLFRPWLHSTQASSSTDDAGLDACIIRYATARRACFGAPCDDCLDSLDQIGAECVSGSSARGCPTGSPRGQRFIEHFREYRYADVGMQCLRSITVPDFERADEVTCGSATVSARAHAANPPPSLPLFFFLYAPSHLVLPRTLSLLFTDAARHWLRLVPCHRIHRRVRGRLWHL